MSFYEGTELYSKYQQKMLEEFANDPLSNFIKKLRNYQTHYKLELPIPVRSLKDNKSWDVIFISEDLLKHPREWNALSKQYITQCGVEVNINKMCDDYSYKIDTFYQWLYNELLMYHKEDLIQRDKLIKEIGWDIPSLNIKY